MESTRRVLFVSSGNAAGGVSPLIRNQALSLRQSGLETEIFEIRGNGPFNYLRHIFILRKRLKEENFDIIHAHYGSSALVALLAKRKECLVVSFMGDDILGAKNNKGRLTITGYIESRVNRLVADCFYKNVILKSEKMLSHLKAGNNKAVIPNGVDTGFFTPYEKGEARDKLGLDRREKIVIFVSNPLRPEKNFRLALGAREKCTTDFRLLTVSNVPQEALVDYYNAADCMVLTSFHEGSPNTVKEAMACNCPVVATDVGDVAWLFSNEPGYFISGFDTGDFACRIEEALSFAGTKGRTDGRKRIFSVMIDSRSVAGRINEFYTRSLNVRHLRNNKI